MKKTKLKIELPSRYNNVKTVLEQTDDPNVFDVVTNSDYVRCIFNAEKCVEDKNIEHIDFEGGPFISLGNNSIYEGHTLKEIIRETDKFQFIFTNNEDKE